METQIYQYTISGSASIPMAMDVHVPAGEQAELPVVIYAHGINGFKDWGGMNQIAAEFAKAGFAFVKFNFSHNGTTPARPTEFYDLEAYKEDSYFKRQFDLSCVLKFIQSGHLDFKPDLENISLIGHSRGGPDTILFAANSSVIRSIITWASVSHCRTPWESLSPSELEAWREKGFYTRINARTKQEMPISYNLYKEYKAHKSELDLENVARSISIPWLIVHGDDDEAVFVKAAYDLKAWCPEARVFIIPETGHTFDRVHPMISSELPAATIKKVNRSIEFLREVQ